MLLILSLSNVVFAELALNKFDTPSLDLLGVDSAKLTPQTEGSEDVRNKKTTRDSESSLTQSTYNIHNLSSDTRKEETNNNSKQKKLSKRRKPKGLGKKGSSKHNKDGNGNGNGNNGKGPEDIVSPVPSSSDVDSKNIIMASQSTYHPPVSSLFLNKDNNDEEKEPKEKLAEVRKSMEEVSSLITRALEVTAKNKEVVDSMMANEKKNDDLIDYKVIELRGDVSSNKK